MRTEIHTRRRVARFRSGALAVTGWLAMVPASGVAQVTGGPPVPSTLSLENAIRLAERYSPTYRQSANDRNPAGWGVRNAVASLLLPSVSANTGVTYSGAGQQRFLTSEFSQPSATIGSNYSINLNWQFDGNTLFAPGVQRASRDATDAGIEAVRMSVRNQVVQQYLSVLEADAQVDIQERQVSRNEENLRLARAQFEVGQRTTLDVRQAEVAKGQADVELVQARQAVLVERLRLFQTLGIPAPTDPTVVAIVDAFPIVAPDWQLEALLAMALDDNPDLNSLRAGESSARTREKATKGQWLPSLNFSAGWSGFTQQFTNGDFLVDQARAQATGQVASCQQQNAINVVAGLPQADCTQFAFTPELADQVRAGNSGFPFNFSRQPFSARVTISLPIFDQFSRNLRISQASAATDDAREQRRARELQVRTDVSAQHYALIAAYQTITIQEANRSSAREQLRLAQERYRLGSGTFFELLDAQVVAEQAEVDYVKAVYAYHRSSANLEAAVGRPLR